MRHLLACIAVMAASSGTAQSVSKDETIVQARYNGPTERYPHGVLGDAIEHDILTLTFSSGRRMSLQIASPLVFEDTEPRVVDLDGDGRAEVITVESHERLGGRLSVWGIRDGQVQRITATPHIGTRFRWLAPIGAADLDGDGLVEIAYVDRPHLAKTLRVWRFEDDTLAEVASLLGVTNHRIGESDIAGGIRDCGQGPEMVVANANWTRLMGVKFQNGMLTVADIGMHRDRASFANALNC